MSFCKNSLASFALFHVTKYHHTTNFIDQYITQVCKTRLVFLGGRKQLIQIITVNLTPQIKTLQLHRGFLIVSSSIPQCSHQLSWKLHAKGDHMSLTYAFNPTPRPMRHHGHSQRKPLCFTVICFEEKHYLTLLLLELEKRNKNCCMALSWAPKGATCTTWTTLHCLHLRMVSTIFDKRLAMGLEEIDEK